MFSDAQAKFIEACRRRSMAGTDSLPEARRADEDVLSDRPAESDSAANGRSAVA